MDYRVTLEAAVRVYDVDGVDEAVGIAISKTGQMLNPDMSYVDIGKASGPFDGCDGDHEPGYVVADEGLVGLELEMTVFGVDGEEHASRIARGEIGTELDDVPLSVEDVTPVEEADGDSSVEDVTSSTPDVEGDGLPDWDDLDN